MVLINVVTSTVRQIRETRDNSVLIQFLIFIFKRVLYLYARLLNKQCHKEQGMSVDYFFASTCILELKLKRVQVSIILLECQININSKI